MRKYILFTVLLFIAGLCFAADSVEGFWISYDDKSGKATAGWEIYTVGNKLFGKVLSVTGHPQDVTAYNCKDSYKGFPVQGRVSAMTVVGTPWIFDLIMDKPGNWSGGQVIDPDEGRMYGCEITFRPAGTKSGSRTFQQDTLEMRGKIGPFGRSQFWTKVTKEQASALR